MIYTSCKDNSEYQYFIEAKSRGDAQMIARLLWGEGVRFHNYETPPRVVRMLNRSDIKTMADVRK